MTSMKMFQGPREDFTPRQAEVAKHMLLGLSRSQIAQTIGLSEGRVGDLVSVVCARLRVSTKAEAEAALCAMQMPFGDYPNVRQP